MPLLFDAVENKKIDLSSYNLSDEVLSKLLNESIKNQSEEETLKDEKENNNLNQGETNIPTIKSSNKLIIPKIGVDTEIIESSTVDILYSKEGVWREPQSGIPGKINTNVIIAGHRFQYLPPNNTTFYYLDRIKEGDRILIIWEGKSFVYEVFSTKIVSPYHSNVRANVEGKNILTIYTCHPIGSDTERFVVQAQLI